MARATTLNVPIRLDPEMLKQLRDDLGQVTQEAAALRSELERIAELRERLRNDDYTTERTT